MNNLVYFIPALKLLVLSIFSAIICMICPTNAWSYDHYLAESLKCTSIFSSIGQRYFIPADILHSIALQESGRSHPDYKLNLAWPWAVNVEGQGYYFHTKREAINFVKSKLNAGLQNIDVGCMQINLKHHPKAFYSLEQAFDPYYNVNYAANFLWQKYQQFNNWSKAIAHYHSATEKFGMKYQQSVLKLLSRMPEYKKNHRAIYHQTSNSSYNYYALAQPISATNSSNHKTTRHKSRTTAAQSNNSQKKYSLLNHRKQSNIMVRVPSYQR